MLQDGSKMEDNKEQALVDVQEETQEIVKLKGIDVEKELLEREKAALENPNFSEGVYSLIGLYGPKFDQVVDRLSSHAMRRLLKTLVLPLDYNNTKQTSEEEKAAYVLGKRLLDCAYTILLHEQAQQVDLASRAQAENKEVTEQTNNEVKENDNGTSIKA